MAIVILPIFLLAILAWLTGTLSLLFLLLCTPVVLSVLIVLTAVAWGFSQEGEHSPGISTMDTSPSFVSRVVHGDRVAIAWTLAALIYFGPIIAAVIYRAAS